VAEQYETQALQAAQKAERKDLESRAALELANIHIMRLEEDKAEPLIEHACVLADASGSILARAEAALARGELHEIRREYEEAQESVAKALDLFTEAGSKWGIALASKVLGRIAMRTGDAHRAEKLFRESIRVLAPMQDRGTLCEAQRLLAQLLLAEGRVDEAEKYAIAARETVSAEDFASRATTRLALAEVYAAQGRDGESETLFREAVDIVSGTEHGRIGLEVLPSYAGFLRERERVDEAAELEARLAELPTPSAA
jgi:tetratricopeptide (TPR) repeat protein